MKISANTQTIYTICVQTPRGDIHELGELDTTDIAIALAKAGTLAQWLHHGVYNDELLGEDSLAIRGEFTADAINLKQCAIVVCRGAGEYEIGQFNGRVEVRRIPPETPHREPKPHFSRRF
jgi:hypothetical protein